MTSISNCERQQRIVALKHAMSQLDLDGYLVTSRENMFYLTGLVCDPLERPFFLLIEPDGVPTFLVPKLEESHIQSQYDPQQVSTYWEYPAPQGQGWADLLPEFLGGVTHLGVEPSLKMEISSALCERELRAMPLVERRRAVKSPNEIEKIRRASECAVEGVELLLAASYNGSWVVEGFADTRKLMKKVMDASDDFNPLLSKAVMGTWSAPRSAQPHSIPQLNDVLRKDSHIALVLTSVDGYAAECERTYFTTRPSPDRRALFQMVMEARRRALGMVKPGVKCSDIDVAAREFFEQEGWAHCLLHRTGHGLGLAYHAEAPWIAEGSDEILQRGMVISIEPGIYLPGACGFRHSDTVLVTEEGCELLAPYQDSLDDMTITAWKPWRRLKGKLIRRSLGLTPKAETESGSHATTVFSKKGLWATLSLLILLLAYRFAAPEFRILRGARLFKELFELGKIAANFREVSDKYPSVTIVRCGPVLPLKEAPQELPEEYVYEGERRPIEDWIDRTHTTGLVILKDGKLVYEDYFRGNTPESRPIIFSVSKSIVSFLIGKALEDGDIRSLDDPVDEYVPKLKKGGYRGVRIKEVLQMSSGIRWNEDYGSLSSDVVRSAGVMMAGDLDEFVATRKPSRDHEPGTSLQYKSADTHVLGMVLEAATGQPFHLYASRKLWARLGAEADARLQVDAERNPVVMGGISMRVRDMARFGQLYLDRGKNLRGESLLKDPMWIDESTSLDPEAAHLQPASTNSDFDKKKKKYPFGYAYQWWIPDPPQGDFCAIGIYGQFIYVNPQYRVVIAKTSAFPTYADKIKNDKRNLTYGDEMEIESMRVFRTIAEGLR